MKDPAQVCGQDTPVSMSSVERNSIRRQTINIVVALLLISLPDTHGNRGHIIERFLQQGTPTVESQAP